MPTPSSINEYIQAEEPARVLLERLRWTFAPRGRWRLSAPVSARYCSRGRVRV